MTAPRFFPDPERADPTGLVLETAGLDAAMLYEAYARGIFPWSEDPVRWYSPDPRAVFLRRFVRLPRKIDKLTRRHGFRVTCDQAFAEVMRSCVRAHAHEGSWIGPGMLQAYAELHRQGHAHSLEVWQGETLAGGLYGVQIGAAFSGESMFYKVSNASKVAFAALIHHLDASGVVLLDAQVINPHTASLGAVLLRRSDYLRLLEVAVSMQAPFAGRRWPTVPMRSGASAAP